MTSPVDDIERHLGELLPERRFATHFKRPADDLRLEVDGLGGVPLPVDALVARELCAHAELARHGYRDETRLDTRVRNTWEIPAAKLRIDEARWRRTLDPALARIHDQLGLPSTRRLRAELHNLLIYEPGQFFAPHQDSEKRDGMLATLVVSLPSRHTGGELLIRHQGEQFRAGTSARQLGFTAFYADCEHEAKPVRSGYRLVLTWNLMTDAAHGSDAAPDANTTANHDALVPLLQRFFATPPPPRWEGDPEDAPPDRLVYLLDHEYTPRGLGFQHLKGADSARVAALRRAAAASDCDAILALADVHEVWDCLDRDAGRRSYRRRDWYADDEEDDLDGDEEAASLDDGNYELTNLIDHDIELRHGVAPDGAQADVMGSRVARDELCETRPSRAFEPFESEYEGYMGNYGNTMERWYHRAALVMWPRSRAFVIRARATPAWGLRRIGDALDAGEAAEAKDRLREVLGFWDSLRAELDDAEVAGQAVRVAAACADAASASILLAPLRLQSISVTAVADICALLARYGQAWCRELLQKWTAIRPHESALAPAAVDWLTTTLPALVDAWCAADPVHGRALAQWLLRERWEKLRELAVHIQHTRHASNLHAALEELCAPMLAILGAAHSAGIDEVRAGLLRLFADAPDALPAETAVALLRAARAEEPEQAAQLAPLHAQTLHALQARLARPPRRADDWSIAMPAGCACELCSALGAFLQSETLTRKEWPLAEAKRRHVAARIDQGDLPVTHVVRRKGSPYVLVLEKSMALFQRDKRERAALERHLQWLQAPPS